MAKTKFLSKVLAVLMALSMLCSTGVFADYGNGTATTDPGVITVTSMLLNGKLNLNTATEEATAKWADVEEGIEISFSGTATAGGTITYLIAPAADLSQVPLNYETLQNSIVDIGTITVKEDGTFDETIVASDALVKNTTYEFRYAYSDLVDATGDTWVYQRYIKTFDWADATYTSTNEFTKEGIGDITLTIENNPLREAKYDLTKAQGQKQAESPTIVRSYNLPSALISNTESTYTKNHIYETQTAYTATSGMSAALADVGRAYLGGVLLGTNIDEVESKFGAKQSGNAAYRFKAEGASGKVYYVTNASLAAEGWTTVQETNATYYPYGIGGGTHSYFYVAAADDDTANGVFNGNFKLGKGGSSSNGPASWPDEEVALNESWYEITGYNASGVPQGYLQVPTANYVGGEWQYGLGLGTTTSTASTFGTGYTADTYPYNMQELICFSSDAKRGFVFQGRALGNVYTREFEDGEYVEIPYEDSVTDRASVYVVIQFAVPAPDIASVSYTPTLGDFYAFAGTGATKDRVTYEAQTATFEAGTTDYIVTVPYGTETVALDAIDNGLATSEAMTIDLAGADSKTETITIGQHDYNFTFKWDNTYPYISDVDFTTDKKGRSYVLRADGASYIGTANSASTAVAGAASIGSNRPIAEAGSESSLLTVNGETIANNQYLTSLVVSREENFARTGDMHNYTDFNHVAYVEKEDWISFKASAAGTVYVSMSFADREEDDFDWDEGVTYGWTKADSATYAGNAEVVYYKSFGAGDIVKVPSQVFDQDEVDYLNEKLAVDYADAETTYRYTLANSTAYAGMLQYSTDAGTTWTTVAKANGTDATCGQYGQYVRANTKTVGGEYGQPFFVIVAFDMPAAPGLESASVTTTSLVKYIGGEAVTDKAYDLSEMEAYEVAVPVGTKQATATITDKDGATAEVEAVFVSSQATALAIPKDVTVEATVGVHTYPITFKWDTPFIYNAKFPASYGSGGYWAIDNGADGVAYTRLNKYEDGALTGLTKSVSSFEYEGLAKPTVNAYLTSIVASYFTVATVQQPTSNFPWIYGGKYTAADASTAAISFNVSDEATVYAVATARDNKWDEIEDLEGWEKVGTISGRTTYAKTFEADEQVLIPGSYVDDAEIATYNASLSTLQYVKYDADAYVTVVDETAEGGTKQITQLDAMTAAGITSRMEEGVPYEWTCDENKVLIAPVKYSSGEYPRKLIGQDIIVYVQFEDKSPAALDTLTYSVDGGEAVDAKAQLIGNEATITLPWTAKEVSLAATITGMGEVTIGEPINLKEAENNTGSITVSIQNSFGGDPLTYTVTFVREQAPAISVNYTTKIEFRDSEGELLSTNTVASKLYHDVEIMEGAIDWNNVEPIVVPWGTEQVTLSYQIGEEAAVTLDAAAFENGTATVAVEALGETFTFTYGDAPEGQMITGLTKQNSWPTRMFVTFGLGNNAPVTGDKNYYVATKDYFFKTGKDYSERVPDGLAKRGVTAIIADAAANKGQGHMALSSFPYMKKSYPATSGTSSDAWMTFTVAKNGMLYAVAPQFDGVWEEINALEGWSVAPFKFDGTRTVYQKAVTAGETVYMPGAQLLEREINAYNEGRTDYTYVQITEEQATAIATAATAAYPDYTVPAVSAGEWIAFYTDEYLAEYPETVNYAGAVQYSLDTKGKEVKIKHYTRSNNTILFVVDEAYVAADLKKPTYTGAEALAYNGSIELSATPALYATTQDITFAIAEGNEYATLAEDGVTLTANADAYVEGAAVVIEITQGAITTEKRIPLSKRGTVTVAPSTGSGSILGTVGGNDVIDTDDYTYNGLIGELITLKATPAENFTFAYWQRMETATTGTIYSYNPEIKINVPESITLKAVFRGKEESATVIVKGYQGVILAENAASAEFEFPAPSNVYGYTFGGYEAEGFGTYQPGEKLSEADLAAIEGIVTFEAIYTKDETKTAKLTVKHGTALIGDDLVENEISEVVVPYNTAVTVKPVDQLGEYTKFSHWSDEAGNIVSYDREYTFYMTAADRTLVAVLVAENEDVAVAAPVLTMVVTEAGSDDNGPIFALYAERRVPNGYTVIENGIIYGAVNYRGFTDAEGTTETEADDLTVDTRVGKKTSQYQNNNGQYTIRIQMTESRKDKGNTWYARTYLIYKDANGSTWTTYSDPALIYTYPATEAE